MEAGFWMRMTPSDEKEDAPDLKKKNIGERGKEGAPHSRRKLSFLGRKRERGDQGGPRVRFTAASQRGGGGPFFPPRKKGGPEAALISRKKEGCPL